MTNETETEEAIVETEAQTSQEAPETPVAQPSLTIQDLGNLRNIVDVAAKRGVFKTEEFTLVGETYAKLSAFIEAITPPATEGGETAADETAAAE